MCKMKRFRIQVETEDHTLRTPGSGETRTIYKKIIQTH